MVNQTVVLDQHRTAPAAAPASRKRRPEMLLREALGESLRSFRTEQGVTLRELAEASRVSPGYLSELERGRKEVSSELLGSICHALGTSVPDVLIEAAGSMALGEVAEQLVTADPADGSAPRERI